MLRIVDLLATSMSQASLFHALNVTALSSLRQSTGSADLCHLIDSLTAQPRTLQALTRHKIYLSLDRVVCGDRVKLLPLPTVIKDELTRIT